MKVSLARRTTASRRPLWWKVPLRVLAVLAFAAVVGWVLNCISRTLQESPRPAGFVRGVVQGALMPMSMPNLLVGKDVSIYAANNTGLTYKLGYTAGVNGCGAIFFGFFFWRVRKWKQNGREQGSGVRSQK